MLYDGSGDGSGGDCAGDYNIQSITNNHQSSLGIHFDMGDKTKTNAGNGAVAGGQWWSEDYVWKKKKTFFF